jgi:hypothetical protein
LEKAATHAPSLGPQPVGATLRDRVGVDLFAESPDWGLARRGPRMLVFSQQGAGLSAPVRDPAAAKKKLAAWLGQSPRRAGRVVGNRLLTASGREAPALVAAMAKASALPAALAAQAKGPLWLWLRLADPLRGAVLSLEASALGLIGTGLLEANGILLAGPAPAGCAKGTACLRAGVGSVGRRAVALAFQQLGIAAPPQLAAASRLELQLESIDARQLSDARSIGSALRITPVFDGAPAAGASLEGRADLAEIDAALAAMTPLDAFRGPLATGAWALHLLYGALLRNAGPLTLSGDPLPGNRTAVRLRLPLR